MSEKRSREDLGIYLKDHYAGGVGALELVARLRKERAEDPLHGFLSELQVEIQADHDQLHYLMKALGHEESNLRNAGAWMVEKFSRGKIGFASEENSQLRLLQSLETLLLGIKGKKLLWRALQTAQETSPVLTQFDLARLEARADEQANRVEGQRLATARAAFQAV